MHYSWEPKQIVLKCTLECLIFPIAQHCIHPFITQWISTPCAVQLLHLNMCHVTPRMLCCSHVARLSPPHTMQWQCWHNVLPQPLLTLCCDAAPLPRLLRACSCFARRLTCHSMQCCCSNSTPAMCSQSTSKQPPCQIAHHQRHPDTGLCSRLSADHPIHRQFTTSDVHLLCNHTLNVQANHNRVHIYKSLFITWTDENKKSAQGWI
jgi:hypothetical protein